MYTKFDKTAAAKFHKELASLLQDFAKKNGLRFEDARGKYTDATFHMKVEFVMDNPAMDGNQAKWNRHCSAFGFTPQDYGRTFMAQGHMMKIVEIQPRKYKYPIIAVDTVTGDRYKFSDIYVKTAWVR